MENIESYAKWLILLGIAESRRLDGHRGPPCTKESYRPPEGSLREKFIQNFLGETLYFQCFTGILEPLGPIRESHSSS